MSGLEPLVLIPIGLAIAQLIQPICHGVKELRDRRKARQIAISSQTTRIRRGGKLLWTRQQDSPNHEVLRLAEDAQKGLEAATHAFVQEIRSSRQQLVFSLCLTVCMAYFLGRAQVENEFLKRIHHFLDERAIDLEHLEQQSWLVSTALWPLRSCWRLLISLETLFRSFKYPAGTLFELVFKSLSYVKSTLRKTPVNSSTAAAVDNASMSQLVRVAATCAASPPLSTDTQGAVLVQTKSSIPEPGSSPAAVRFANNFHLLMSYAMFLLNYPANFIIDFVIAFLGLVGVHRLVAVVPLGLLSLAILCFILCAMLTATLNGEKCRQKTVKTSAEFSTILILTLIWAASWRFLAVFGAPKVLIEYIGVIFIIFTLVHGRVSNCGYVVCAH